jgi:hypothetical protein
MNSKEPTTKSEAYAKIRDLKLNGKQSIKGKLMIQKLQQKISDGFYD